MDMTTHDIIPTVIRLFEHNRFALNGCATTMYRIIAIIIVKAYDIVVMICGITSVM